MKKYIWLAVAFISFFIACILLSIAASKDEAEAAQVKGVTIERATEWEKRSVPTIPVTTTLPVTTSTIAITTTTVKSAAPISHRTTTTVGSRPVSTSTSQPVLTALQIAQNEVGLGGSYTKGGYWCAKFVTYVGQSAKIPNFVGNDSAATLYWNYNRQGLVTTEPRVGDLIFIDLSGQNFANQYISHIGIVESVNGTEIRTIEGNADRSGLVTRQVRHLNDGYVISFGRWNG